MKSQLFYKMFCILLFFSLYLGRLDTAFAELFVKSENLNEKSKLYTRVEKLKVDYFINDFLHRQNINDCFSFEDENILQLKCLRNKKLTNVHLQIESESNSEYSETIVV